MTERRFSDKEVAKIFERAADAQHNAPRWIPPADGMTLAALQEIGHEVGIPPELVARAAQSLDHREVPATRHFLRFPIGVGRTVELGRHLTDAEWERLVVDLRQTFDARGNVRVDGAFREWTNGNLHALLEPTATGHRLRLGTLKGDARGLIAGGLVMAATGLALITAQLIAIGTGDPGALGAAAFLTTVGLGMFGVRALGIPGWARLRQQQMDAVAARLTQATMQSPPDDP